jgi:hypothetical protein
VPLFLWEITGGARAFSCVDVNMNTSTWDQKHKACLFRVPYSNTGVSAEWGPQLLRPDQSDHELCHHADDVAQLLRPDQSDHELCHHTDDVAQHLRPDQSDHELCHHADDVAQLLRPHQSDHELCHHTDDVAQHLRPDQSYPDVVTAADREVEEVMREMIAARYPGHAIIGEEFGTAPVVYPPPLPPTVAAAAATTDTTTTMPLFRLISC